MSIVRIDVEPKVIMDAVSKSGRSLEEIKERYNSFDKWMNAELNPTLNQLKDLSSYLRIPFGYLLLRTPVEEHLPLLEFRTIDTDSILSPSRELVDTIRDMERKQYWLRDTLIEEGKEKLKFVGMFNHKQNITLLEMAEKIRDVIGLNKKWFEDANSQVSTFSILRDKLSQNGIVVMQNGIALSNTRRALDIKEFRAFTLVDEYAPLIFINNKDSNSGKAFSILHELAHTFFGRDSLYNDDYKHRNKYKNSIEVICNKLAGEIIAPTDIFISGWTKLYKNLKNDNEKISSLADDFRVSKLVIARKALEQKYINQKKYNEIADIALHEFELNQKRQKHSDRGGHPVNNALSRLDKNFLRTLITSTEHGETQYTDAYRIAGVGRGVFEDLTDRLNGVR